MLGRACGRHGLAVDVGVVEEADAVEHEALLGRRLALEHLLAIDDARVLLDEVVARARGDVVAVAPDRRPRVIGKERTQELVAVVRAHGVVARADGVAHRVRALRTLSAAGTLAATTLPGRHRWCGRGRRRLEEGRRLPGLTGNPDRAHIGLVARRPDRWLIGPRRTTPEERHHDEPAIGNLVVAHDRVAVVRRLALPAEALEEVRGWHRTVEHAPSRVELPALLREDGGLGVDDLHDVIGPDGERVVRRVANVRRALRSLEADAETVKARDEHGPGFGAVGGLFNRRRTRRSRDDRRHDRGRRCRLLLLVRLRRCRVRPRPRAARRAAPTNRRCWSSTWERRGRVLKETRPAVTSVRTTPIPRVRFMSESLADEGVVSEHHTGGRRYQLITLIDGRSDDTT